MIRIPSRPTRLMGPRHGAARFSEKIQPDQVIPGRQEHQPQHQNQPKPKSDVLGPLTERPPQNSFACIVQKMPPVEERNRKKIGQADAYRKDSHQIEQRQKADIRPPAGSSWRCPPVPRSWSVLACPVTIWAMPQERGVDDVPGLRHGRAEGADRAIAVVHHRAPWDGRTPITIWFAMLPRMSRVFISRGVTQTVRSWPPRWMPMARGSPPLTG